ncbi:MAG TPA: hypothetical protein VIY47_10865, partial [Ignavibacteriaceae bacterium]
LIGFNSHSFDVPALISQQKRYLPQEYFPNVDHRDVRNFWRHISGNSKGKLTEVGLHYRAKIEGAHRALADVWTCAQILEAMLEEHGLEFFDHPSGTMDGNKRVEEAFMGKGDAATRTITKESAALSALQGRKWISIKTLAKDTGISEYDLGFIVPDLVEAGKVPGSIVEHRESQKYFKEQIPAIIEKIWTDENRGKTKPLMEALKNRPYFADYLQLRLYLVREGYMGAVEK